MKLCELHALKNFILYKQLYWVSFLVVVFVNFYVSTILLNQILKKKKMKKLFLYKWYFMHFSCLVFFCVVLVEATFHCEYEIEKLVNMSAESLIHIRFMCVQAKTRYTHDWRQQRFNIYRVSYKCICQMMTLPKNANVWTSHRLINCNERRRSIESDTVWTVGQIHCDAKIKSFTLDKLWDKNLMGRFYGGDFKWRDWQRSTINLIMALFI